jgi:hypothetical protein
MIYHEDGVIFEVEILNNNSNNDYERYTLKVIKNISSGLLCKAPDVGDIFECEKKT